MASLDDKGVTQVRAAGNYCYALAQGSNELYAWGMGENYVLGTRDDENEYEPKVVHPKQFNENRVRQVGSGVQHVVVLTTAAKEAESRLPEIDRASMTQKFEVPKDDEPAKEDEAQEESKNGKAPAQ